MSSFVLVVFSEDSMVVISSDVDRDDVVNIGSVEGCVVDEDVVVKSYIVNKGGLTSDEVSCVVVGVVEAAAEGSIKGIVECFVESVS